MASRSDGNVIIDILGNLLPLKNSLKDAKSIVSGAASAMKTAFNIVGTAVAGATTTVGGLAAAAVNVGKNYETSLNKVASIADTTAVSINGLSDGVKALSLETGQDAAELNEALYQTISATGDTANALSVVETAVKAAKGGFTDTVTAVDGLTTVLILNTI